MNGWTFSQSSCTQGKSHKKMPLLHATFPQLLLPSYCTTYSVAARLWICGNSARYIYWRHKWWLAVARLSVCRKWEWPVFFNWRGLYNQTLSVWLFMISQLLIAQPVIAISGHLYSSLLGGGGILKSLCPSVVLSVCPIVSAQYLLSRSTVKKNFFLPNLVWWCIIMRQCVVRKNWFSVKVTVRT